MNLYREDLFYADAHMMLWSMDLEGEGKDQFELFSDRFRRLYPGYCLDPQMRIRARPETALLSMEELVQVFRSKDESIWRESAWMFEDEPKFLSATDTNSWNKCAIASFPRSGTSFLRNYCELLTGVQTGSDTPLRVTVDHQMLGSKGEGLTDETCWLVKTHSPFIMSETRPFKANKMIYVIRNPLDVIVSLLAVATQGGHSMKMEFDCSREYPVFWDFWVRDITEKLAKWYEVVLHDARMHMVPTIFVRYEDLVEEPEHDLSQIICFLTRLRNTTGTNAERQVQSVLAKRERSPQGHHIEDNAQLNRYSDWYSPE